jgi:hypothetical protein
MEVATSSKMDPLNIDPNNCITVYDRSGLHVAFSREFTRSWNGRKYQHLGQFVDAVVHK